MPHILGGALTQCGHELARKPRMSGWPARLRGVCAIAKISEAGRAIWIIEDYLTELGLFSRVYTLFGVELFAVMFLLLGGLEVPELNLC